MRRGMKFYRTWIRLATYLDGEPCRRATQATAAAAAVAVVLRKVFASITGATFTIDVLAFNHANHVSQMSRFQQPVGF